MSGNADQDLANLCDMFLDQHDFFKISAVYAKHGDLNAAMDELMNDEGKEADADALLAEMEYEESQVVDGKFQKRSPNSKVADDGY